MIGALVILLDHENSNVDVPDWLVVCLVIFGIGAVVLASVAGRKGK